MHISSSYAKILGDPKSQTREIPRSGSKAKDGEKKKERLKVGNNNGHLCIATQSRLGQFFLYLLACCVSCDASCEKNKCEPSILFRNFYVDIAYRALAGIFRATACGGTWVEEFVVAQDWR